MKKTAIVGFNKTTRIPVSQGILLKFFFDECFISSGLLPPRSLDLSSLDYDYFLWGYLKDQEYSPVPATFEDMKGNTVREIDRIPFLMMQRVINNAIKHAQARIQGVGGQFEHMLQYFLQYIFTIVLLFFSLNF